MALQTPAPESHQTGALDITTLLLPNLTTKVDKYLIYRGSTDL